MDAFSAKSAAEKYLFDTTDIASTVVMLINTHNFGRQISVNMKVNFTTTAYFHSLLFFMICKVLRDAFCCDYFIAKLFVQTF